MVNWFDGSLVGGPTELSVISLTAIWIILAKVTEQHLQRGLGGNIQEKAVRGFKVLLLLDLIVCALILQYQVKKGSW